MTALSKIRLLGLDPQVLDKDQRELLSALEKWLAERRVIDRAPRFVIKRSTKPDYLVFEWKETVLESRQNFLTALIDAAMSYRVAGHEVYTLYDRLAFHAGYYLLSQGQNPFDPYKCRSLGTVGFREEHYQTYLSLTDPVLGHVFGTTCRNSWMKGAIVHVEHLERPAGTTRAQIESYRIPSVLEFARVCLHTGYAAPNTCYIGRPLRDNGDLKYDFIKVVDTVASACTSMFQLGSAECKIAMGSLKASDMVAYMRALRGHTLKNYRQCFSAAFNLNTPLIDGIRGKYYTDPVKIARRAIKLTVLGGFDKVTWDGASDSYPSVPTLILPTDEKRRGLLSLHNARELVHQAHSAGLLTYFSAGFKADHISVALNSGVDGIARDQAAQATFGTAAKLLARLDQMYYEGSLSLDELQLRKDLYDALVSAPEQPTEEDENKIKDILSIAKVVLELRGDEEVPFTTQAERLVRRKDNKSLLQLCAETSGEWSTLKEEITKSEDWSILSRAAVPSKDWAALQEILENFLSSSNQNHEPATSNAGGSLDENSILRTEEANNSLNQGSTSPIESTEGAIHSFPLSPLWKKLRKTYKRWLEDALVEKQYGKAPKYFSGNVNLNIKATPFENANSPALADLKKKQNSPNQR
ncbi:hypothetical protein B0J17DRAFT_718576 [Rhizoctonia solani]|nr:hypothetical protein B0J17DRAFT_718576 [Rhizoctonia solani]